jgi:hypothetical protein
MKRRRRRAVRVVRRRPDAGGDAGEVVELAADIAAHTETSPRLTGGDVDADWHGAGAAGDEAVGGSTATPDQDVIDELGEALGVAQASDAEVVSSEEILRARDRHRWHLERDAVVHEEGERAEEEGPEGVVEVRAREAGDE